MREKNIPRMIINKRNNQKGTQSINKNKKKIVGVG